jgi:N-methylhydantoinase B
MAKSAELSTEAAVAIDPITYEVIRHRLMAIVAQQSVVLKSISGSPVVTDANDCNTGIYLPDGEIVVIGPHVIVHAGSMGLVVPHIIEDCTENPGIGEGDTFITSDPYKGALHMPDVTVLEPVFWEGERIAWVGGCAHELDVGGMNHSSWCPQATEYQQEGLILPPTKLVEGGRLRQDVWNLILAASRLPDNIGLDLRAMLAANAHGKQGLLRLIDRYGVQTVVSVMRLMLERTESQLRSRLESLPDGRFRARTYLDHDGHANRLYTIELDLHKQGDSLLFDYEASSEQAPGFINTTQAGLWGGVMAAVLPLLCHDIPWNGGAMRMLEIRAREGLVVNARRPAPCSSATLAGSWLVEKAACEAVSRLLCCSDELRGEAMAQSTGSIALMHVGGLNQYGEPFGGALTEGMMGGGGATVARAGIDFGGPHNIITYAVPNSENSEALNPILHLRHSINSDSAGAGRHRGGVSCGSAWTLHDAPFMDAVLSAHGVEMPTTLGIFGGHPGSCHRFAISRATDVYERLARGEAITRIDQVDAEPELLEAKPGLLHVEPGDVFDWTWHGGGGWGDPTEADPAAVARDVELGLTSSGAAADLYGVVTDAAGLLDADATARQRAAIRDVRRAWPVAFVSPPSASGPRDTSTATRIGEKLVIRSSHVFCDCGYDLGPAEQNWKVHAARGKLAPHELGPLIRLHEELEIRAWACPGCGVLHSIEIARIYETPLHEVALEPAGCGDARR